MPARVIEGAEQLFREVYELMYKYQMLAAQEYLPDRALNEFLSIQERLKAKLKQSIQIIVAAATAWRENEEKYVTENVRDLVLQNLHLIPRADLPAVFKELVDILGADYIVQYWSKNYGIDPTIFEGITDSRRMYAAIEDYLDGSPPVSLLETLITDPDHRELLLENSRLFDSFISDESIQQYRDETMQYSLVQIPVVEDLINTLQGSSDDLSDLLINFQLGLNTVHHTGPLATWILGRGAEKILNDISDNSPTALWNQELQRVLGRPPSFVPEIQEWYQPEAQLVKIALSKNDLKLLYELTYKYGWLSALEREEGWLPDKAYMEKARIEEQLVPKLNLALGDMIEAYDEWLLGHEEEPWIAATRDSIEAVGLEEAFPKHWNISLDIPKAVVESLGLSDRDWLIEYEDADYLIESYGAEVLRETAQELSDEEAREALLEQIEDAEGDAEELQGIMNNYNLDFYSVVDKLIEDGWTAQEYLRELSDKDLLDMYQDQLDLDLLLADAYRQYLDNFPGLEENIEEIGQTNQVMQQALESDDISEKILAFQLGLTTAHHHGEMVEHILGLEQSKGTKFLTDLSNKTREETKEWDRYLEKIMGKPIFNERAASAEKDFPRYKNNDPNAVFVQNATINGHIYDVYVYPEGPYGTEWWMRRSDHIADLIGMAWGTLRNLDDEQLNEELKELKSIAEKYERTAGSGATRPARPSTT